MILSAPQQLMVAAIAVGVAAAGGYFYGRSDGRELERGEWTKRDNAALREANAALDALRLKVLDDEHKRAEGQAALAANHDREMRNAKTELDAALARVRAERAQRLRERAAASCPADGGRAAEAPAAPAGGAAPAEEAGLSEPRDESLVRLLAEADDVVRELNFCWSIVRKDRGL